MPNPELLFVGEGFSFFDFVEKHCCEEASKGLPNRAFHRLCSLMRKMNVQSCVLETIPDTSDEIKDEVEAIHKYFNTPIDIIALKFSFISEKVETLEAIRDLDSNAFLSSSILINFKKSDPEEWRSYIYKSFLTEPKIVGHPIYKTIPLLNNYLHINKTFHCTVSISDSEVREYELRGTFFCQQNGRTSVCAHACLCMTINNMDLKNVGLITPEDINRKINVDHVSIKFNNENDQKPKRGLDHNEIKKVITEYGLSYFLLNFFDNPNIEYNDHIYKYIESKYPVMLAFSTDDPHLNHLVPILGHTLNSDMWWPEAEIAYAPKKRVIDVYRPASAWVDHFLIHDDNFGMYYCMPIESLKRITLPKYDRRFRANYAIAIIPSQVTTHPREAEWGAINVFKDILDWRVGSNHKLDIWTTRLFGNIVYSLEYFKTRPVVIRTLLCSKKDYRENLEGHDFEGNYFSESDKEELTNGLPDLFWLSEITLPELYTANRNKIVDVIYRCDYHSEEEEEIFKNWIQIRFPFVLIKLKGDKPIAIPMSVKGHYPLFKHKSDKEFLDW